MQPFTTALLWFAAISCGLLAGLYFAFSTFIMTAFSRIELAAGVAAMNAINVAIVRSLFIPLFFGSTLACALLAVVALLRFDQPGAAIMLIGGLSYVVGMFVCTMVFNVPLNNALAAADVTGTDTAQLWARYLKQWTLWNHVRTVASTAALALFIAALVARAS